MRNKTTPPASAQRSSHGFLACARTTRRRETPSNAFPPIPPLAPRRLIPPRRSSASRVGTAGRRQRSCFQAAWYPLAAADPSLTAFGRIGFPRMSGAARATRVSPFGFQASGGFFDCSGFAWRVFKRQTGPAAAQLALTLGSRTARGNGRRGRAPARESPRTWRRPTSCSSPTAGLAPSRPLSITPGSTSATAG